MKSTRIALGLMVVAITSIIVIGALLGMTGIVIGYHSLACYGSDVYMIGLVAGAIYIPIWYIGLCILEVCRYTRKASSKKALYKHQLERRKYE